MFVCQKSFDLLFQIHFAKFSQGMIKFSEICQTTTVDQKPNSVDQKFQEFHKEVDI